jgi:hypothetical protein
MANFFNIFPTVFGSITQPQALSNIGTVRTGPAKLLNLSFRLLIIGGGIYALFNFIFAGYDFLSAGNDPQKIKNAWAKIWQTMIGLVFMVGVFLLAAILGILLFNDSSALLSPSIPVI